jgi:putative MFS transporter
MADPARTRMLLLLLMAAYGNYLLSTIGTLAPLVAESFSLDDAQIAYLAGFVSMGALGAVALGRLADRQGRRRSLVLCVGMLPPLALASMLAPGVASYTAVQVLVLAFNGTLLAALTVVISEEALEHARPRMQAYLGLFAAGGSSLILVLVPVIADLPYTWRWAWLVAVLPAVAFRALRRRLVETALFE